MAGKKIMLWPSARTKYLSDKQMKTIQYMLIIVTVFMVLQNYYLYSFMYGMKLLLMVLVSIVVTKEVEILFYTHDKDITREEAKTLIAKSYPTVTAMIYALLIPVGTPLWLIGLGAALATLLGKLLFGGYHHMVFHSSLVGVILVTLGWSQIVESVAFMTAFDNYVLELLFDNSFFNETLAIGGFYDPELYNSTPMAFYSALGILEVGTENFVPFVTAFQHQMTAGSVYPLLEVVLGLAPGITASGLLLLGILGYLIAKKLVNWVLPISMIGSFLVVAFVTTLIQGGDLTMPIYHLFAGYFLFVVVFVTTDPITTPIPMWGKVVFGVMAGALTFFIRLADTHEEGVLFATLFMMMLTPMLNEILKEKQKPKKAPKKAGANV